VEKGLHLALVHAGKFHRDLWIVFLEVPTGNRRLFRFSLEKILDWEVAQPLERRGSAPSGINEWILADTIKEAQIFNLCSRG
jgi:hypothetical protein